MTLIRYVAAWTESRGLTVWRAEDDGQERHSQPDEGRLSRRKHHPRPGKKNKPTGGRFTRGRQTPSVRLTAAVRHAAGPGNGGGDGTCDGVTVGDLSTEWQAEAGDAFRDRQKRRRKENSINSTPFTQVLYLSAGLR